MVLATADTHDGCLVVQRRELGHFVYLGDDVLVDDHRPVEVLAALHDAVAYRVDFIERIDRFRGAARERLEHDGDRLVVIGHLSMDAHLVRIEAVLVHCLV